MAKETDLKTGFIVIALSLLSLLLSGCVPSQDFDSRLGSIVNPHRFSTVKWESSAIPHEIRQWAWGSFSRVDDEAKLVTEYFSAVRRIKALESAVRAANADNKQGDLAALEEELSVLLGYKAAVKNTVERILERQIKQALAQQGILNPIDRYIKLGINIPPLNFKLEQPPHLLVISPRYSIASIRRIYLQQDLSLEEKENIEAEADKLNVSSLVVELGGLAATYPSFVADDASLMYTVEAAAEEWLHQYLVFKPLGFLYLLDQLGVSVDYEIVTMNETTAGMVSKEIAAMVMERFYPEQVESENKTKDAEFDFDREMREIRRAVDSYLAEGKVEEAEQFMEQRRQFLASKGHYIRKLNQAYFAFHGTYADSPTSIDPIGQELKELRSRSASLKDFLDRVAVMTSRQDLIESLE
jgi:hypothetical protein